MIDNSKRQILKRMGLCLSLPLLTTVSFSTRTYADTPVGSPRLTDRWSVGGTNKIISPYPNDSIFDSHLPCAVKMTEPRTLGPCFFSVKTSDDISDGQSGLPMMLCMKLIGHDCNPLVNYEIEVWHANSLGIYSADTRQSDEAQRFRSRMCSNNNQDALESTWFRGSQITDSRGRVNFKSCFPGWYAGRTIHIHVRITHSHYFCANSKKILQELML
ncbi:hypothetical protein [Marinomonas algicola]|uniref:dioxygenase family protein n=1 Tax=Marinomonas algicola TaxID=2773454 RepID=UPI00174B891C|nr:hypothetical protein [Marinomonas algicola]